MTGVNQSQKEVFTSKRQIFNAKSIAKIGTWNVRTLYQCGRMAQVLREGAKPDWAAKITKHCSRETTSDGRSYHQDATWTTSQSRHVMGPRGSGRRRGRPTKTWR